MGFVYDNFLIRNVADVNYASGGYISEDAIHQVTVRALVDTGAMTLVISETLRKQLGLNVWRTKDVTLGNGKKSPCMVTEPVEVHWKDRMAVCQALVTSENGEVLLGVIPLEMMDLTVNPTDLILQGIHGDEVVYRC